MKQGTSAFVHEEIRQFLLRQLAERRARLTEKQAGLLDRCLKPGTKLEDQSEQTLIDLIALVDRTPVS